MILGYCDMGLSEHGWEAPWLVLSSQRCLFSLAIIIFFWSSTIRPIIENKLRQNLGRKSTGNEVNRQGGLCTSWSMSSVWISVVLNTQICQKEHSTGMYVQRKLVKTTAVCRISNLYRVFIYQKNLYQIRYSKSTLIKMSQLILSLSQRFMS